MFLQVLVFLGISINQKLIKVLSSFLNNFVFGKFLSLWTDKWKITELTRANVVIFIISPDKNDILFQEQYFGYQKSVSVTLKDLAYISYNIQYLWEIILMGMDKTVFAKKIRLPLNREKYFIFLIVLYPVVLFEVKRFQMPNQSLFGSCGSRFLGTIFPKSFERNNSCNNRIGLPPAVRKSIT